MNKIIAKVFHHGTAFTMSRMSVWVVHTDEGPVVRMWVPFKGWYFCDWSSSKWEPTKPCSADVFVKLVNHVYTEE